jgi:hypothetical protein
MPATTGTGGAERLPICAARPYDEHAMVMEVHTGSRPGRPQLLLIASAAFLVGTLALAFLQVTDARALGERQAVPGTPLTIRIPQDWVADRDSERTYMLPIRDADARRGRFTFERRIQLDYRNMRTFLPYELWLDPSSADAGRQVVEEHPATIGPWPGVEFRCIELRDMGTFAMRVQTLLRVACSPRGEMIRVYYEPLMALRPADFEIMDEVCQSLAIEDPSLVQPPEDILAAAGLQLPLDPTWTVAPPRIEGVAGIHISGRENGYPLWAISLCPTWLAQDRQPADLLSDYAAEHWRLFAEPPPVRATGRADGRTVTWTRHPRPELVRQPAAALISTAEGAHVMMYISTSARYLESALAAAEEMAGQIEIAPSFDRALLEDAWRNGRRLVSALSNGGLVGRWGRQRLENQYIGHDWLGRDYIETSRSARGRNAANGYAGQYEHWLNIPANLPINALPAALRRPPDASGTWTIGADAQTFERIAEYPVFDVPLKIVEERYGSGPVTRVLQPGGRRSITHTWQPTDNFIAPPAEDCIAGWVARGEAPHALVEIATPFGAGSHFALVRQLPPRGSVTRCLWQSDFWPVGVIRAFDDDEASLQYERWPAAYYEQIGTGPHAGLPRSGD